MENRSLNMGVFNPFRAYCAFLCLCVLIALSCSGGPANPVQFKPEDFPAPPINIKLAVGDREIALTWGHSDPSRVKSFQVFRQDSVAQAFQAVGTTSEFSFVDSNLQNGRTYGYAIAAVGENGLVGKKSPAIIGVPAIFGILINSGQAFTNTLSVTLTFAAPSTTTLTKISNDSTFSNAQWENFATPRNWTLSPGDGVKRVFVKFRNARDVETVQPFIDSIVLDTEATIRRFTHDAQGRILTPADTIHLALDAGETGGRAFADINNVQFGIPLFDDGSNGDSVARDGIYELDYIIPTGPQVENTLVIGKFADRAGNVATNLVSSSGRVTVRRLPTPVDLIAVEPVIGSSRALTLFWSINSDNDFANYRIFRSLTPGINTESPLVTIIQSRNTLTHKDSTLAPNTTYYYRVFVYDATGLFFGSNERSGKTNP